MRARGRVLETWLKQAPLGVVVLSALLVLLGSGFTLAGIYLALSRRGAGWAIWLGVVAIGPLIVYVGVRLLTLTAWAWGTMVLLVALLLLSSLVRALYTAGFPTVPVFEIALELGALAYLTRPAVRRAFGR